MSAEFDGKKLIVIGGSAGMGRQAALDYAAAFYDSYLSLNFALFFLTQTVAKGMIVQGGGSIVFVGSMWAHQVIGLTPSSGYSMQKAGPHALTHNLAIELAEYKIRVNAVAPAVVKTLRYEGFIAKGDIDATLAGRNQSR